jgi:predicted N-acetyltransferase YhbS
MLKSLDTKMRARATPLQTANISCGLLEKNISESDLKDLRDLYAFFYPSTTIDGIKEMLKEMQDNQYVLVARDENKIVGMIILLVQRTAMSEGNIIFMRKFIIHPEYRNKKLHNPLYEAVCAIAQQTGCFRGEFKGDAARARFYRIALGARQSRELVLELDFGLKAGGSPEYDNLIARERLRNISHFLREKYKLDSEDYDIKELRQQKNIVFHFKHKENDQAFFFKIIVAPRDVIEEGFRVAKICLNEGLTRLKYIPGQSGQVILDYPYISGAVAYITEKMDGVLRIPGLDIDTICYARTLARMHNLISVGNIDGISTLERFADIRAKLVSSGLTEDTRQHLARENPKRLAFYESITGPNLPDYLNDSFSGTMPRTFGMMHGDAQAHNILFDGDVGYFLDFDSAARMGDQIKDMLSFAVTVSPSIKSLIGFFDAYAALRTSDGFKSQDQEQQADFMTGFLYSTLSSMLKFENSTPWPESGWREQRECGLNAMMDGVKMAHHWLPTVGRHSTLG